MEYVINHIQNVFEKCDCMNIYSNYFMDWKTKLEIWYWDVALSYDKSMLLYLARTTYKSNIPGIKVGWLSI